MKLFHMNQTGRDTFQVHLCDGQDVSVHADEFTLKRWEETRQLYLSRGYCEAVEAPKMPRAWWRVLWCIVALLGLSFLTPFVGLML